MRIRSDRHAHSTGPEKRSLIITSHNRARFDIKVVQMTFRILVHAILPTGASIEPGLGPPHSQSGPHIAQYERIRLPTSWVWLFLTDECKPAVPPPPCGSIIAVARMGRYGLQR